MPPASPAFAPKTHAAEQEQHSGWPVPSLGALQNPMTPNVHEAMQQPSHMSTIMIQKIVTHVWSSQQSPHSSPTVPSVSPVQHVYSSATETKKLTSHRARKGGRGHAARTHSRFRHYGGSSRQSVSRCLVSMCTPRPRTRPSSRGRSSCTNPASSTHWNKPSSPAPKHHHTSSTRPVPSVHSNRFRSRSTPSKRRGTCRTSPRRRRPTR